MEAWGWSEVGARVAAARRGARITQQDLADRLRLDRTAISKIESGTREIDARELVAIATALGRSVEWFVTDSPPALVSRRAEREDQREDDRGDAALEEFARDVVTLVEVKALTAAQAPRPIAELPDIEDRAAIVAAAAAARHALGMSTGEPALNLIEVVERAGLYTYVPVLGEAAVDGAYVFEAGVGVCIVNGSQDPGRRRYTLAHELGHHLLGDAHSTDWGVNAGDHERVINAFAAEFLLPEPALRERWPQLVAARGNEHGAAISLGIEFRVSWTALLHRLRELDLVGRDVWSKLEMRSPTKADYMAAGASVLVEMEPPMLSPGFAAAVLHGFRMHRLTAGRAVAMLRGQLSADELPAPDAIPLEALRGEFY